MGRGLRIGFGAAGSGSFETTFNSFFPTGISALSQSKTNFAKVTIEKPAKATGLVTPSFTTETGFPAFCATRVADATDTVAYVKHDYARRQAFNCDDTRFIARATNSYWYLFNAADFTRVAGGRTVSQGNLALGSGTTGAVIGDCELWWHPTDRDKFYWMDNNGGMQIRLFDIVTKVSTVVVDFTGRLGAHGMGTAVRLLTGGEGRPSNDGRYVGLMVRGPADSMLGIVCVDLTTDTIVGSVVTTNQPDHVSMSPSGTWVVPSWSGGTGQDYSVAAAASINSTNGVRVYSRDFSTYQQLNTYGEHSDMAIARIGGSYVDVMATVCFTYRMEPRGVFDGQFYFVRLDNANAYVLDIGSMYDGGSVACHFSGCTDRKNVILISTQASSGDAVVTWNDEELKFVELTTAEQKVVRLGKTKLAYAGLDTAPVASVNRGGTRVIYTCNFGNTAVNEDVVIGLPSDWSTQAAFSA